MHVLPWVSWHSEVLAFLAVLMLASPAVAKLAGKSASESAFFPAASLPLLGIAFLIGMQWMAGLVPFFGDFFVYWAYLALCMASMWLGYSSVRGRPKMLVDMASVVLAGALASAAIALGQAFNVADNIGWIHGMPTPRRPGANLGQPNQLATLLLMGVASALFLCELGKLGAVSTVSIAVLLVTGIAATESRSGVLGYIILNIWWLIKRKPIESQLKPWLVALIGFLFLVLYWYWPLWMAEVFQLEGGVPAENIVAYRRWTIWPQLLQAVLLRPWWGWGFGQVSAAHNAVVGAYPISEAYTYAHNILLDLALGIGLPIAILILLMVSIWALRRSYATRQLVPWYCIAVVIPVLVHSMVEFPYAYAYFLVPVMFMLGTLEGQLNGKPGFRLGFRPMAALIVLAGGLFICSSIEYFKIEEDFRTVRFESLNVGQTPQNYERPTVHLLTQLDALLNGGRLVPRPNMSAQDLELSRVVAMRYPWVATQNRYALSLALNGKLRDAAYQLRVIRAQHGEKTYRKIKEAWKVLATEKYPQLLPLSMS